MAWTSDELTRVGAAEELEIQSTRQDGTLRGPVTIWMVRAGDEIYVRSVKGPTGKWWRHAVEGGHGHVSAGGVEKDVAFGKAGPELYDDVDAAYRAKYGHYSASIVGTVLTPHSRESTLRLVAR